ncbi:MAG: hypothetical protein V5A30_10525 [Haloarculaceae archaeon]
MSWSRLPGTEWTPRIGGIPTGVAESMGLQRLLAAVGVLVVVAFAVGALWTLGTETLVSSRQVAAVVALVIAFGALAAVVAFSVTTTE